jgi:hypothetical protein
VSESDDEIPASSVVIHHQAQTGVYINSRGQIVIRQIDHCFTDMYIIVSLEHVPALLAGIEAAARSPDAGFCQDTEEPDEQAAEDAPRAEPDRAEQSLPLLLADTRTPEEKREAVRAALIAGVKSNRQIAADCGCSEATVRRVGATLTASDCESRCDSRATLTTDARDDALLTHEGRR